MGLIILRAFSETRTAFDWAHKWVRICVAVVTVPLVWFYLWSFGQGKAVYGEMNTAAATIAAIATIALVIFLINLCRAPLLIIQEKDLVLGNLLDEKALLEEKLKPVISVLYEGNKKAPYYHTDEGERFKLLRIGIRNDGYTYLEGVQAKLIGVKQLKEDTADPLFNGKFPAALHLKGDNPPDRFIKEFVKEFSINARSTEYIDVAQ